MVAAISANLKTSSQDETTTSNRHQNPSRPPLLPSERDNGITTSRRPKSKEINSRYMSSSSSSSSTRRYPSPSPSPSPLNSSTTTSKTTTATPLPVLKRSQSVERRRIGTPRPTTPLPDSRPNNNTSNASKILFTSTRSLSVSFQGESFSLPISKTKPTPSPNLRKSTPERRTTTPIRQKIGVEKDQMENSKPSSDHQHRWPAARSRQQVNPLTRSVDFTGENKKKIFGSGTSIKGLLNQSLMIDNSRRASSFDARLHSNSSNAELLKSSVQVAIDDSRISANGSIGRSDLVASDSDSVSSGSNSGTQECGGIVKGSRLSRGISVPARFWQETNSRLRRLQDPGTPFSSTASRGTPQPKLIPARKSLSETTPIISSPRALSNRALSSPLRGPLRPASPSKIMTPSASSPSRGMLSPARTRNAVGGSIMSNQSINTPSILSFAADVRRGKMGETRVVDAHLLRLLYNRNLQWRFVNARTDYSLQMQRITAEKNIYNAWVTMSELRDSVTVKRIKLQLRRQNLQLTSILKGQMSYLEEWALLDRDHASSLSGAIEALKASTLRLPVVGGARADIQNVKDAVGSAVDVMQAMASSICYLLSKVEEVNSLVGELANVTTQERRLLDQCKDLLSTVAAMQVKDSSLRTHLIQLKRLSSTSLTTPI